jgi:A/G-specific adenine glycosylase
MEFPYKQPKKPRRKEKKNVYLLEYQGKYALRKRPDQGLLSGLWEFPTVDCGQNVDNVDRFLDKIEKNQENVDKIGKGKHIFSHIEWHMTGYHILLKEKLEEEDFVWVTKEEMEQDYAVPSAYEFVRNYLFFGI